jgi:hypothetical protein
MTSRPARSAPQLPSWSELGETSGLLVFGAVLLLVLGAYNCLHGLSAIFRPAILVVHNTYVFGTLAAWGWSLLALGILQILAGVGVLARNQLARWFGVAVIALNMFAQIVFLPFYPAWSLLIIAVDVVALFGLTVYGGRPPGLEEARPGRATTPAETPTQATPWERRQPV